MVIFIIYFKNNEICDKIRCGLLLKVKGGDVCFIIPKEVCKMFKTAKALLADAFAAALVAEASPPEQIFRSPKEAITRAFLQQAFND
jgi:hypothetical protein